MRCCSATLWHVFQVCRFIYSSPTQKLNIRRQWQSLISVPAPVGYASVNSYPLVNWVNGPGRHPPEPQCSYDPVEGLTLAPDTDPVERMRELEDEICKDGFSLRSIHSFPLQLA